MSYSKEELEKMLKNEQMTSIQLQSLLKARDEEKIDFVLMDIREVYEFSELSIKGADMLIPTSVINRKINVFEELKNRQVVLYCRTGSRTGQVMYALKRMGYENVVHLSSGIMGYTGETVQNAPIPS